MNIRVKKNDYLNWQTIYEKVLNSGPEEREYRISVAISTDITTDPASVLELCYFFPLADFILQQGKRVIFNIEIQGSRQKVAVQERIQALVQAQLCRFHDDSRISIRVNGQELHVDNSLFKGEPFTERKIYSILSNAAKTKLNGALQVSMGMMSNDVQKRKILLSETVTDEEKTKLKEEIEQKAERKYNVKYDVTVDTMSSMSRIAPIITVGLEHEDSSIYLEDLIRTGLREAKSDNPQVRYLYNMCYTLRSHLEDKNSFVGTPSHSISTEQKEIMAKQLKEYLAGRLSSMNLLNQIIWLYILRDLQYGKELVKFTRDTNGSELCNLDMELLENSALNAVSYAEGLYQLIENACLYSNGKRAYWGMRMYRSRLTGGAEESLERAVTNKALYEKYRLCASTERKKAIECGGPVVSPQNLFTKNYSHLLEFYVIDEAVSGNGILMTTDKQFDTIEDLLESRPQVKNGDWESFADEVANHYGLRVFYKIIERNDGYIIARSPCFKEGIQKTSTLFRRFNSSLHDLKEEERSSYTTSFHILAPLLPEWNFSEKAKARSRGESFDNNDEKTYKTVCIKIENHSYEPKNGIAKKVREVNILANNMEKTLKNLSEGVILTVDMREGGMYEAELLAKAMFILAIRRGYTNKMFYVAVLFKKNSNEPQEFIRIFSSFYDKMENVYSEDEPYRRILKYMQIAICTSVPESAGDGQGIEVNFVLVGDSPLSAYQSANNYLYMNFYSSLKFLPMLRYIAYGKDTSSGKILEVKRFPFDIYLSKQSFQAGKEITCNPWMNCLFLDRMKHVLNTDLQEHTDGCRIPGIHLRLGSKLHMDVFYEAELLFRSIGNINGFAYIIANDLIGRQKKKQIQLKKKTLILVGYEKYAVELVMQIFERLKMEGYPTIACVIPATGNQKNQCVQLSSYAGEILQADEQCREAIVLTIIPVGSTMSTIYKIRNIANKHYGKDYSIEGQDGDSDDILDYCIVAVNDQLKRANEHEPDSNITWKYWESFDTDKKLIWVKPEKRDGRALPVRYLLNADAKWSEPAGLENNNNCTCEECLKLMNLDVYGHRKMRLPLLQVDKTSMIPNTIFKLKDNNLQFMHPKNANENKKRIEKLYGLVRYGHIYENDNHYQFHFDLGKLFQNNKEQINKWLEKIEKNDSAFNIIIAPNHIDSAPFLCAVMEKVFSNSLRYLHLDINGAYREDVRLKFSQVADEYKSLKRDLPNVPFNVYYIADTITSGKTISRAQLLVRMLLNESGLNEVSGKFTKVILLLCRSAYDTMKQFVDIPERDVAAWIVLNIPPYNMQADRCPACDLLGKYALLRKRSTTKTVSGMFERLEHKHTKRSCKEYDQWLLEDILQRHSYYAWFKQWFFFQYKGKEEIFENSIMTVSQVNNLRSAFELEFQNVLQKLEFPEKDSPLKKETCLAYLSGNRNEKNNCLRDEFRRLVSERSLKDLAESYNKNVSNQNKISAIDIAQLIRDTVIATRNYMRLVCLQEAYEELIIMKSDVKTIAEMNEDLGNNTKAKILEIISKHLHCDPQSGEEYAENAEWLISFIKVLSREYIVKYYHIHLAMVNLMYDMLAYINYGSSAADLTIELKQDNPNWIPIVRTLRFNPNGDIEVIRSEKTALCASLQFEVFMTLVHRLSVLQCSLVYEKDSIDKAIKGLGKISEKYFGMAGYRIAEEELINALTYTELPPTSEIRDRYIKSVKTATMMTTNDDPCYRMAREIRGEEE